HSGRTATTPHSSTDKARTRTNRNHDETLPPQNLQTQTQIRARRYHPLRQLHIPGLLRRSNTPRHLPRLAPRRIPGRIQRPTNRIRRTPPRERPKPCPPRFLPHSEHSDSSQLSGPQTSGSYGPDCCCSSSVLASEPAKKSNACKPKNANTPPHKSSPEGTNQ